MKKSSGLILMVGTALAITGVSLLTHSTSHMLDGEVNKYVLNLGSTTDLGLKTELSSADKELSTALGNKLNVHYENAKKSDGNLMSIGNGGYLTNVDPISGMALLDITFEGSLNLQTALIKDQFNKESPLMTSAENRAVVKFNLTKDYFKLTATEDTIIKSLDITYTCATRAKVETDVRLEAEDGVIDGKHTKIFYDERSSNGAYACDINDCGQGIELQYYCHVPGKHLLNVAYLTGTPNSKHGLYVNSVFAADVIYKENTGWDPINPLPITDDYEINLKFGWNTISLVKHGFGHDNPAYGGYAKIDYITIKGTNKVYDPDANKSGFNLNTFSYEAEVADVQTGGKLPQFNNNASGQYFVGDFDAPKKYVEFNVKLPESHQFYDLVLKYAKGGECKVNVQIYNHERQLVAENLNHALADYENQAWDNFKGSDTVLSELNLIANELYHIKVSIASGWNCFDRIDLVQM